MLSLRQADVRGSEPENGRLWFLFVGPGVTAIPEACWCGIAGVSSHARDTSVEKLIHWTEGEELHPSRLPLQLHVVNRMPLPLRIFWGNCREVICQVLSQCWKTSWKIALLEIPCFPAVSQHLVPRHCGPVCGLKLKEKEGVDAFWV